MRTVNIDLLKIWCEKKGRNGKAELAAKSEIHPSSIGRILRGEKIPDGPEQLALCLATGHERDRLFPIVEDEKEAS
jgi:hypothetical protein